MTRLFVVVEGQTEAAFTQRVLGPHLDALGVFTAATIVGKRAAHRAGHRQRGGGSYLSGWKPDIKTLLASNRGDDVCVTTLFDLYGLPSDFPSLAVHTGLSTADARAHALEIAMANDVDDHRFIPFLMKHEFEALVLAALSELERQFDRPEQIRGVERLRAQIGSTPPEDVNDGPETAPSKRLVHHVPRYCKTVHGPTALENAGLSNLRARCPRFDCWVSQLEALA